MLQNFYFKLFLFSYSKFLLQIDSLIKTIISISYFNSSRIFVRAWILPEEQKVQKFPTKTTRQSFVKFSGFYRGPFFLLKALRKVKSLSLNKALQQYYNLCGNFFILYLLFLFFLVYLKKKHSRVFKKKF